MPRTAYVTARVEPRLKKSAQSVLERVGLSTTDAITIFLRQVVLHRGLPFDVRLPNKETRQAIAELETGGGKKFAGDNAALFAALSGRRKA
jgi:DNA-damage-inducible protein J